MILVLSVVSQTNPILQQTVKFQSNNYIRPEKIGSMVIKKKKKRSGVVIPATAELFKDAPNN